MGVIDILQTDINHVGGITGLWKVAQMAAVSGISMAPHACEGPIGGLATLHVDAAMPNFVVQEICGQIQPGPTDKIWEEWLGFPAMRMVDGRFPLSQKPGLGFDLTEQASRNIRSAAPARWRACFTRTVRWRSGSLPGSGQPRPLRARQRSASTGVKRTSSTARYSPSRGPKN